MSYSRISTLVAGRITGILSLTKFVAGLIIGMASKLLNFASPSKLVAGRMIGTLLVSVAMILIFCSLASTFVAGLIIGTALAFSS